MKRSLTTIALVLAVLVPDAARAAESAEEGGSWLTLTFFAINFLVFVGVIVYAAGPAIKKYFADRASVIHSNLAKSEQAFEEAEDLARAARERMAKLEEELANLARELGEETTFQTRRVSELARSNSERIRHDSAITANAMAENAQRRVREHLARVAARLARDLISRHFESADQSRLLQGFMERLGTESRQ